MFVYLNYIFVIRELFLGNLISSLMRIPQFEDPIDTVKDLVDQNITIFSDRRMFQNLKEKFKNAHSTDWLQLSETMVETTPCGGLYATPKSCAEFNKSNENYIKYKVHGNKTHAFIQGYLTSMNFEVIHREKNWWRSEKVFTDSSPYGGVMTSRNWILNEVKDITLFYYINYNEM